MTDQNDERTRQEKEVLELFELMSEEDRAAFVRLAQYMASQPDGPKTLEEADVLFEKFKKLN